MIKMSIPRLCFLILANLIVLGHAKEEKTPVVEASTNFPVNGWGIADFTVGLIYGAYAPL